MWENRLAFFHVPFTQGRCLIKVCTLYTNDEGNHRMPKRTNSTPCVFWLLSFQFVVKLMTVFRSWLCYRLLTTLRGTRPVSANGGYDCCWYIVVGGWYWRDLLATLDCRPRLKISLGVGIEETCRPKLKISTTTAFTQRANILQL